MKVAVIPPVICAFEIVSKGLVSELGELDTVDRAEAMQTATLVRSSKLLRRILET